MFFKNKFERAFCPPASCTPHSRTKFIRDPKSASSLMTLEGPIDSHRCEIFWLGPDERELCVPNHRLYAVLYQCVSLGGVGNLGRYFVYSVPFCKIVQTIAQRYEGTSAVTYS
jgi:hypothetical protein